MDDWVSVGRQAGLLHAELARPEKRNALSASMYARLAGVLAEAEADPGIRCVVISGQGTAFCAGNDLHDFVANPPGGADAPVFRFLHGLAQASKVVIAAVQGRAVGIGTTMLLHCDFVFAEPDAEFSVPFVDLALVPEAGSSLLMPALMGQRRAAEMLLLGEPIGAARAAELGLITKVSGAGRALADAMAVAERLGGKPAGALSASKRLMKLPPGAVGDRIDEEARVFGERLQSPELHARVQAFFARK